MRPAKRLRHGGSDAVADAQPVVDRAAALTLAANALATDRDADVILYNGDIGEPWDRYLAEDCAGRERRKNVVLVPVTYGGDPHAAYRMARCLEGLYEHFAAFVVGPCKSAGTLLVTGAHELVVSDQGELGPLDMQMRKTDELWAMNSGLTVMEAMNTLQVRAYEGFEEYFIQIMARSQGRIGFRTATQVSSELVVGLFAPLYTQIDPMLLGEASRAMQIASDYAQRLGRYSRNLQERAVDRLVAGFSAHGFVIDRDEASTFFMNVRAPDERERALDLALRATGLARVDPLNEETVRVLSDPLESKEGGQTNERKKVRRNGNSGKKAKAEPATRRTEARANGDQQTKRSRR